MGNINAVVAGSIIDINAPLTTLSPKKTRTSSIAPSATISGTTSVCRNGSASITFTGSGGVAPYTFEFFVTGLGVITQTSPGVSSVLTYSANTSATRNYVLLSVTDDLGTYTDLSLLNQTATITVVNPTAAISGGPLTVCNNAVAQNLTVTFSGGTAPYTLTYSINGVNQTPVSSASGTTTIPVQTSSVGTFTYALVSVQESSLLCTNATLTSNTSVTVNPLPTATITASTLTSCTNLTAPTVTITGTGGTFPLTVTYRVNVNGVTGSTQYVQTDITGVATLSVLTATATYQYELISLQESSSTACVNASTSSVTIVVNPVPDISNQTPAFPEVCRGTTSFNVTFDAANSPDQYKLVWGALATGQGFTDVPYAANNFTVAAGKGTVNFAVPAAAAANTYTGTIYFRNSATGCEYSNTSAMQVKDLPIAGITGGLTVCQFATHPALTLTASGGTNPFTITYAINGTPQTPVSIPVGSSSIAVSTNLTGTNTYSLISVQESSTTGCINSGLASTTIVTINPTPIINTIPTPEICAGLTSVNASFGTSNDAATYSLAWVSAPIGASNISTTSFSPTTANIPISVSSTALAGTYSATVTFASSLGCTASADFNLNINALPTVVTAAPAAVCSPLTIDLTAPGITSAGSTAGLSYTQWTDVAATSALLNANAVASSGTYYIKGTIPSTGCSAVAAVVATINPLPTVVTVAPAAVCSPLTIDLTDPGITSAGSTAGLSYTQWTDVAATSALSNANAVASSGTYYIKGTIPSTGCSAVAAVVATINPLPTVVAVNPAAVCSPLTIDLTAPGITSAGSTAGLSYTQWTDIGATVALTNPSLVSASGTYYIKGTIPATGCSVIAPVVATINALPTPSITASGPLSFCAGNSVDLTASGGMSYAWAGGPNTAAYANITTGNTYSVTVTNAAGCSAVTSTTVTVNALPTPTISASGPLSFCAGNSVNLTASGGVSYAWAGGPNTAAYANITTGNTYSVTVTNAAGCTAVTSTTVTVNALPTPSIAASGPLSFCAGNSVNLTASGGVSYAWAGGPNTAAYANITTGNIYSVTVTNAVGCTAVTSTTVTVNALPTPTISASGPLSFCAGNSVNLTASGGVSYAWAGGPNTATYANITTGNTYSVTVTNAAGCSAVTSTTVTVKALPTPTISASGPLSFCAGNSVNLTASGGVSYAWSGGPNTAAYANITTGNTYTVTVTNAAGCTAVTSTTVTVNALPTPTISASGPLSFCAGNSVNLTASGGVSYAWAGGPNTATYANITTGNIYSVTVTNAAGCTAVTSTTVTVNALPTPSIAASGPLSFCVGNSVNLTASGGVSYAWAGGPNTATYANITTGNTYSVTVTNAAGCTAMTSTTVTVNPLPNLQVNTPAAVCSPGVVNLTLPAVTSGSTISGTTYTYYTNAAATQVLQAPTAVGSTGTYYIKSTFTATGCAVVKAITVTITPQASITINTPAAVCAPSTVNLTAAAITAGSEPGLTFAYYTDAAAQHSLANPAAVAGSGIYYIKGTPVSGCSAIVPVALTINPLPQLVVNNPAAVCAPAIVSLTDAAVTNGSETNLRFSYFSDASASQPIARPSAITGSGTYYIKAEQTITGCTRIGQATVTINPEPSGQLLTPAVTYICEGSFLTLNASGAQSYQWLLNQQPVAGATGDSYQATQAGEYTVQFRSGSCVKVAGNPIKLEMLSKPDVNFSIVNACAGTATQFNNQSQTANSGGINWLWDFGDGTGSNQVSATHIYQAAGNYIVTLTASNPTCNMLVNKTIGYTVPAAVPAIRYADKEVLSGVSFVVSARSIGVQYLWQPVTGINNSTLASPTFTVTQDTRYTVSITSDKGCNTVDTLMVKVIKGAEIYVPQGFTPNGDGQNDRLFPILVGIQELKYFKVFNRWGNLVFQTKQGGERSGWDGTVAGSQQMSGSYTWIAEGLDITGSVVRRTGTVLLIR
jgi:gliding motility-associated-like protein